MKVHVFKGKNCAFVSLFNAAFLNVIHVMQIDSLERN